MQATIDLQDTKDPGYEIFIIFVSILSVINLLADPPDNTGDKGVPLDEPGFSDLLDMLNEQARQTIAIRERLDRIEQHLIERKP
jgi:hypothetical protein